MTLHRNPSKLQGLGRVVNRAASRPAPRRRSFVITLSPVASGSDSFRPVRILAWLAAAVIAAAVLPLPLAAQREARVVRQLDFQGNESINDLTLASAISTTSSSWFATAPVVRLLGLGEKRYFNQREFERDVIRLAILYKRSGFPNVTIDTLVRREPEDIYITFDITEGAPIVVDSMAVQGLDAVPGELRQEVLVDLPLRPGDVFNRYLMQANADSIVRRLRDEGYPAAEVFTSFATQAGELTADLTFDVEPGAPAVFGDVRVEGIAGVDTAVVLDLMAARQGREFSQSDLFESQRNLYSSDLFRIATVGIDSSRYEYGADSVPIVVQVAEARRYRVRGSLGYGTNDCFRGTAGLSVRNFLGRGRILDLSTRVSKVGVGSPTDWGMENRICSQLVEDSIGSRLMNYGVNAAFRRPAFLSPNNTITYALFAERRSEFAAYLREDVGGNITIARETPNRRLPLSLSYTLSYGKTEATAAIFCAFFNTCLAEDIDRLRERRRFALLTATGALPRVNNVLDPTRGYILQLELGHASRLIGSSQLLEFTRGVAEASWYRQVGRESVFSWRVKGGLIFAPEIASGSLEGVYIPPEQRFYAGGPSDVRGFRRNELGPVIYVVPEASIDDDTGLPDAGEVRAVATGGNSVFVANAELRFPSPIFSERLRLAAFIDGGALWQRGVDEGDNPLFRVTPGFGLRVGTPLGPARLDLAYNPYSLPSGRLLVLGDDGELTSGGSYDPPGVGGLTVHFAVGQPF